MTNDGIQSSPGSVTMASTLCAYAKYMPTVTPVVCLGSTYRQRQAQRPQAHKT